jgi:hypothetical protein
VIVSRYHTTQKFIAYSIFQNSLSQSVFQRASTSLCDTCTNNGCMAARQEHCVHMTLAIVHDTEELDTHSDIGSREKPRRVIVVESPLSTFTIPFPKYAALAVSSKKRGKRCNSIQLNRWNFRAVTSSAIIRILEDVPTNCIQELAAPVELPDGSSNLNCLKLHAYLIFPDGSISQKNLLLLLGLLMM